jgi:hypothetical protein
MGSIIVVAFNPHRHRVIYNNNKKEIKKNGGKNYGGSITIFHKPLPLQRN